jgi:serine/threonine protein phosphatase 1
MGGRTLIIGDIHGRYQQLLEVLECAHFGHNDRIITLGDVVDYGHKSKDVVDYLIGLQAENPRHTFMRGNHEDSIVSAWTGVSLRPGFLDLDSGWRTLRSYGHDPDVIAARSRAITGRESLRAFTEYVFGVEHLEFFQSTVPSVWVGDWFLSHAGLHEHWPVEAHEPEHLIWGDYNWLQTRSSDNQPPCVFGHWHQMAHPLFAYKKIGLAMVASVAVMIYEEMVVVDSEYGHWRIQPYG